MPLDTLVKKSFAWIAGLILALAAYFQASGVVQLVAASFLPASEADYIGPPAANAASRAGRKPPPPRPSAGPIIDRNPFDSETGPLTPGLAPVDDVAEEEPESTVEDVLMVPNCAGVEVRIVTESSDPVWSIAHVKGSGTEGFEMHRVGEKLGAKQIVYIGYNPMKMSPAVWFNEAGQLCQALLFPDEEAQATPPRRNATPDAPDPAQEAAESKSTRGRAQAVPPEMAAKIQKVSDTEFAVDRSLLNEVMDNQATLMRSARIVPEQKNGETVGIRLFGIRPDTLLGTLGIQNGDRLEEINGFKMGSPEQALEAYARLRSAQSLTIKVTRRGKPMTIDYKIN
jgi:general secretion pathway protein C